MEINPVSNTYSAPVSEVQDNFLKEQISLIGNDIKAKTDKDVIALSQNVKDYLHTSSGSNPLDSFSDKKLKFNDFNIDVNDAYKELNSGEMIPLYDNFIKGTNNEERFAKDQSTLDKWGNGLVKLLGKTGTSVLGGTLGTINGVAELAKTGAFKSTYDNDFNNWLDDLNTKMDYNLPNYYTQQEKNNTFLQNVGTANFWANDVLGGASFTLGAIVSEGIWAWATGGTSLSTTFARQGARLGKLFGRAAEVAEAVNEANIVSKGTLVKAFEKIYSTSELPTKLATTLGKTGELLNTARFTYTSAGFESGVEARNYMREAKQDFASSFYSLNGRKPTEAEYSSFESKLNDSANSLFGFNMAIVGSSNLAIFGKLLDIKSPVKAPSKWINETLFGIGTRKAATGEVEQIAANRVQNILAKTYSIGKAPIIEGLWEEGMQSAGSNSAKSWIKSSYDPKYMGNTIGLGSAFVEGLGKTYTGKDGWKEIGIGMIIGLLSGTGVSLASGQGVFGELNETKREVADEVTVRNDYTTQKLLDRIHTANRIAAFTEQSDNASEKGDMTGAELSRASAMIAHMTSAYNFGYTGEALKEVKAGIEAMDNDTLKKQYNLKSDDEVQNLKQTLYSEYSDLSDEYKKQRDFVEYMINSDDKQFKVKGENNSSASERASQVKEAVAYELTLGRKSFDFSREVLTDIQNSVNKYFNPKAENLSDALEVQDVLWSAGKSVRNDFKDSQRRLKQAKTELERLDKERLSLESRNLSKNENAADLNRLNAVTVNIEVSQKEVDRIQRELEGVYSAAQLQNPYNNKDLSFVSSEQLESIDTDLNSVNSLVQDYKSKNPREGYRLEGLIREYQKSKSAFIRYADLSRQISDPELGLRGKRNVISELVSEKTPTQVTLDFLKGVAENADQRTNENLTQAVESGSDFNNIKNSMIRFEEPKKVSTIEDIVKDNPYLFEYKGTADNSVKPKDEEIEEYRALTKRIKRSKRIDNDKAVKNRPNYYSKKGINIPLSTSEMQKFQELNQKMSDWRLYESAFNSEGISIADLIEQDISREKDVIAPVIQDELTIDDYVLISTPEEAVPGKKENEFRKSSVIQTYENVKVQIRDNNYQFSHLKIESLVGKMSDIPKIIMKSPKTFDENNYVKTWSKPKEIDLQELLENQDRYGTIFNIVSDEKELPITVMDYGRLQIPISNFSSIKNSLGLDIFKQLTTNTSYSDLYEVNSEGEYVQKSSDFKLNQELGAESLEYTPEEVLEMSKGVNTFFKVNMKDTYNDELKTKFENGDINLSTVIDQVKVYNTANNGKILGDLKSNKEISDSSSNFFEIRRMAAEILLNKNSKQDVITIPYTAKVKHVLLGTPDIKMIKTEDGVIPDSIGLTDAALNRIEDYGFIENGILSLKNKTTGVRTDFVSKLSKKSNIPVIIFKEGSYSIAYPVSLVKREGNQVEDVQAILSNRNLNRSTKTTLINNLLSDNGISPTLFYSTEDNQNVYSEDGSPSPELQSAITALENKKDTVDVQDWLSSSHDKSTLKDDITITVNLENRVLKSPKAIIDFDNSERNDSETPWYDLWVSTGEISDEEISILANKAVEAGLNLGVQGAYIKSVSDLNSRNTELKRNIQKLSDELKYTSKETSSDIQTNLLNLKSELTQNIARIQQLNSNPSLSVVAKNSVFNSQELDAYSKESKKIKTAIDRIVNISESKQLEANKKKNQDC